jgi:SAM-dependent methyltransferase
MPKGFYNEVYREGHASDYGSGPGMAKRVKMLREHTYVWLTDSGLVSDANAKILEIGPGMSYLADIHPGWHGAEYSATAVELVKSRDGGAVKIYEEDAESLSFEDSSFDGIYTWAALEHVPNPHNAFCEIHRVLRRGGHALIAPAWNCRSWTVKKLEQRSWSDLNLVEKLERISIPLREHALFRALKALPARIWSELSSCLCPSRQRRLSYKSLSPRWDLIDLYGHVSDDDALADIDLHAAIIFFRSRGYRIVSHQGFLRRILCRSESLVVQKVF